MTTTISQILSDLAGQLKLDSSMLSVAKQYMSPEEAAETEKTIARARELAEQARQKSLESKEQESMTGTEQVY